MRTRAYRALLRLFPRAFRRRRGRDMERMFEDMCAERMERRGRLGPGFWLSVVWDTSTEAGAEWLSVLGKMTRPVTAIARGEPMTTLISDLKLSLRQLRRQPGYAVTVIALMAIGIAGNAAVFRVFNGLFLKPLPFDEPERLVDLDETAPAWDLEYLSIAYRDFDTWRAENTTFESMAAIDLGGGNFMGDGEPRRVDYLRATHDIDDVLGISPVIGRFYGPEEDHPDGPRAMLLTQGFWQQEYGSDPGVIGRTATINGFPIEIVGVLPPEASFLADVDMWLPVREVRSNFNGWGLNGIGRLEPDASIQQARDELTAIHKGMADEFQENEISSPVVNSLRDRYLGEYRLGTGFLLGAVGIVLLIACANIAGLMFVRSLSRGSEMSVRLALGAPRGRIIRQLLTEGLVLGILGAGAGAALGIWGSNALVAPMADQFPSWVQFDLDGRFLTFTLLLTLAAAVLFGLAPALQASRSAPGAGVRGGAGRSTASRSRRRGMSVLVTGEVAMALALLVVGGLSVLDVRQLGRTDPGFEPEGLIHYSLGLPSARYPDAAARSAFHDEYLAQLEAIPGVESAAIASDMPLNGHWGWFFQVDGAPARSEEEGDPVVLNRIVSTNYFETAGVQLVAGRFFDEFDGREDGVQAVVVNQRFVETHLSHLPDPVGAQITPGTDPGDDPTWMTVVGVARNVLHYGVDEPMRPGVYQPLRQLPLSGFVVALKVRGESAPVIAQARAVTSRMDVELPVYGIEDMTQQLAESLWTRRAMSWLIGAFSTIALLLAIAGIYGVISYSVGQRAREISIRMAMGARRSEVVSQVLRQGMGLVALGVVFGLAISLAGAGRVSGILVGVDATEPIVYIAVTTVLFAVAALANYVPARRAASLDPMTSLRGD